MINLKCFKKALMKKRFLKLMKLENKSARSILGYPDDLKLKSSMTLFKIISSDNEIFSDVLEKYFNGEVCGYTKNIYGKIDSSW